MSEPVFESPMIEETFAFREMEPMSLSNSYPGYSATESLSGLKELVKAAPFSPGKQSFDLSLRARLASVDNSYSGSTSHTTPISEDTDTTDWLSNERPLSPGTDTSSSSHSTAPSPPTSSCLLYDDENTSPRMFSDTSSEPSRDTDLLVSPPSSRKAPLCSPGRPVVHLNLSNNSLKNSSGSSPFREGNKKYTRSTNRTKSVPMEPSEATNPTTEGVRQRLDFQPV